MAGADELTLLVSPRIQTAQMCADLIKSQYTTLRMCEPELALGEMCNVVKNTYGDDAGGFIGGQVYEYTGFVSEQGSFDSTKMTEDHLVIIDLLEIL